MFQSLENILIALANAIISNIFITGIVYLLVLCWQYLFQKTVLKTNILFFIITASFVQFLTTTIGVNHFSNSFIERTFSISNYTLYFVSVLYIIFLIPKLLVFIKAAKANAFTRKLSTEKHFAHLRLFVEQSRQILGISKKVKLIVTQYSKQAFTFGIFKPIIVLPLSIVTQLDSRQIEAIILHELSHIQQNDYFKNYCVQIIKSILYFNPFIHYFADDFIFSCEKAADNTVTNFEYNKKDYASALLLLAQTETNKLALHASKNQSQLLQRIKIIFNSQEKITIPVVRPVLQFSFSLILFLALFLVNNNTINKNAIAIPLNNHIAFSNAIIPVDFENNTLSFAQPEIINSIQSTISEKPKSIKKKVKNKVDAVTIHFISPVIELTVAEVPKTTDDFRFSSVTNTDATNEKEKIEKAIALAQDVIFELYWTNLDKSIADAATSSEKEKIKALLHYKLSEQAEKLKEKAIQHPESINWSELRLNLLQSLYALNLENTYNKSLVALAKINNQLEKEKDLKSDSVQALLVQKQDIKQFIKVVDSIKTNSKATSL